ncbi:MAG: radical SAM protein [Bacteroidales bacterium]|nr:radical SAM protein [Bacteroidales bacterium]
MKALFLSFKMTIIKIVRVLLFIRNTYLFKVTGGKIKYPKVLQLPITNKCNCRCVMCNIWKNKNTIEFSLDEFAKFLKDPIFKKIESVGINGGEPSLLPNLPDYVDSILTLPKLKHVNIISNGLLSKRFLFVVEEIYKRCKKNKVTFHLSFSLDGVGNIHNTIRGIPNAFEKVVSTIDAVKSNKLKYCDDFNIGCTIVNQNVNNLVELEAFAKAKEYPIITSAIKCCSK